MSGRRGRGHPGGEPSVAARPSTRPPRDPERPPPRPVSKESYRRRRVAALLAAVLLLVGIGFGVRVVLYDAGLFDVEGVQVVGAAAVPQADVLAAAAVPAGAPLADLDPDAIAARVAQLPPVASVAVEKSWPHTVTVTITERVPVATVVTSQGPALVDRTGVVYRGAPADGLPRLTTVPTSGDPATVAAVSVVAALPDALRAQVDTAGATVATPGAPGQVALRMRDGKEVRWGTAERSGEKAAALAALLTQPGTIYDVTSPDLPTIRR